MKSPTPRLHQPLDGAAEPHAAMPSRSGTDRPDGAATGERREDDQRQNDCLGAFSAGAVESPTLRSEVEGEDWRDTPEYHAFLEECAKHCRCTHSICDGVLAGGFCYEIIEDDDDYDDEDGWEMCSRTYLEARGAIAEAER